MRTISCGTYAHSVIVHDSRSLQSTSCSSLFQRRFIRCQASTMRSAMRLPRACLSDVLCSASVARSSLMLPAAAALCLRSSVRAHSNAAASPSPPSSSSSSSSSSRSSIDASEVAKFAEMAAQWWDPHGQVRPLHRMNSPRVQYIRSRVMDHWPERAESPGLPLRGLKVLDVGCGGGLLSESLARLGGNVLGIDAASASVRVAQLHARRDPILAERLEYSCCTAESLLGSDAAGSGGGFDIVCALEVVEHVAHPPSFVATLSRLVRPGGMLFLSTINQTTSSWLLAIVGAEYVLRYVPVGTHEWHKFLSPATLQGLVENAPLQGERMHPTPLLPKREGIDEDAAAVPAADSSSSAAPAPRMRVTDVCGMVFNPLTEQWSLQHDNTECNYILAAVRPADNAEDASKAQAAATQAAAAAYADISRRTSAV